MKGAIDMPIIQNTKIICDKCGQEVQGSYVSFVERNEYNLPIKKYYHKDCARIVLQEGSG